MIGQMILENLVTIIVAGGIVVSIFVIKAIVPGRGKNNCDISKYLIDIKKHQDSITKRAKFN